MLTIPQKKRYEGFDRRMYFLGVGVLGAFSLLVGQLWRLQVVQGDEYALQAKKYRLHVCPLTSPRGIIYGNDPGVVLADNRPAYDLVVVPHDCGDAEGVCRQLAELVQLDLEGVLAAIQKNRRQPFKQIVVKRDVSKSEMARVEEFSYILPGVSAVVRPQRRYPYNKTAGQVLGYVGREEYGLNLIGRAGLEKTYDAQLRGTDGQLCVNVYASEMWPELRTDAYGRFDLSMDSYGHRLDVESRIEPVQGESLFLTLDIGLQAECERLLTEQLSEEQGGAIAVLDADTGAVLALASAPGYDPNVFVTRGEDMNLMRKQLLEDPNKRLQMINRAYQVPYPPGSVFKILLAIAALEEGVITESSAYSCGGWFTLNPRAKWRCWTWKRGGHGTVQLVDALAYSCDVFFYHVGLSLGVDRIHEWSTRLGLGVVTGVDLHDEKPGLIPSREWKEQWGRKNHPDKPWEWRWYDGETVNMSIGQGRTGVTPLQNAVLMAAVVNGGRRVRPYLNKAIGPAVSKPLMSERTLRIVQEGMRKCVEKDTYPTGTGIRARVPGMVVLGKTGTAQRVARRHYDHYKSEEDIPVKLRDHALFIAGVLDREPKIAVSVVVEHGLHGSNTAAPLAKDVIEYFYTHRAEMVKIAKTGEGL